MKLGLTGRYQGRDSEPILGVKHDAFFLNIKFTNYSDNGSVHGKLDTDMRIPQPSWRGSKVVLATFYMFNPLHGIELTEQGVLLGD